MLKFTMRFMISGVFLLSLTLHAAPIKFGNQKSSKIVHLNKTLQNNKATWFARDNWLTQLPKADLKRMMGLQDVPPQEVEFIEPLGVLQGEPLPTTLDWRDKDGKNWVSPILNQANCGSCVAFAIVGALETQMNISALVPGLNNRLSPQNLFSCGGGSCDFGWSANAGSNYLQTKGLTDEACLPYTSGATGKDVSCEATCSDAYQRTVKIIKYTNPTKGAVNFDSVKKALQKGPLVATMRVFDDFISYGGGVYKYTSGEIVGGHAIVIVGYDDVTQSFIIRNSWGDEWGEKGFAHVAYSDISGIGINTWLYELPSVAGAVIVVDPKDYSYISGNYSVKASSTYANTESLNVSLFDKFNKSVWNTSCMNLNSCGIEVQTKAFMDGKYELQVDALDSQGQKIGSSMKKLVYVVNRKPDFDLSFKGVDGVDLSRPLKGRIEFDIRAFSSTVPMTSLEFHYKGANGLEKTKTSNVVLDKMTMGWRTQLLQNGEYEIWMVGKIQSNQLNYAVESAHMRVRINN